MHTEEFAKVIRFDLITSVTYGKSLKEFLDSVPRDLLDEETLVQALTIACSDGRVAIVKELLSYYNFIGFHITCVLSDVIQKVCDDPEIKSIGHLSVIKVFSFNIYFSLKQNSGVGSLFTTRIGMVSTRIM